MELNRSDADAVPSAKLNPRFDNGNPSFERYGLGNRSDILRASFIDGASVFQEIDDDCDIKQKAGKLIVRRAVLSRMLAMYQHWFDELHLAKFFPK